MNEIQKQDRQLDMFIFAKNSAEMARAQDQTIKGFEAKIALEKQRKADLETNLALAKKNKWRTETLKRHVGYAENKVAFYEKVLEALKAGYQIVPEMDIDVFAIRTSKEKPRENRVSGRSQWGGPSIKAQVSDHGPAGEGEYVSPDRGVIDETRWEGKDNQGKPEPMMTRTWEEFGEPEFPFQLVKPQILELTGDAMKRKIFDEMGILPRRTGADPVVIGRITLKGTPTYQRKSVNFMVAWFIDLEDF